MTQAKSGKMSPQVKRVRRKRVKSFRFDEGPLRFERIALWLVLIAIGCSLGFFLLSSGPKVYNQWRESRLLQRAHTMQQQDRFDEATRAAHQALLIRSDSLRAYYILAESTEKQNRSETVTWRAQIARLLPTDDDHSREMLHDRPTVCECFGRLGFLRIWPRHDCLLAALAAFRATAKTRSRASWTAAICASGAWFAIRNES
jgi:hypothetical protein